MTAGLASRRRHVESDDRARLQPFVLAFFIIAIPRIKLTEHAPMYTNIMN